MNGGEWNAQLVWRRKKLITGEETEPLQILMCKREDGRWIYRRPTEDEEADFDAANAW